MIGAISMHIKVADPAVKSLPAFNNVVAFRSCGPCNLSESLSRPSCNPTCAECIGRTGIPCFTSYTKSGRNHSPWLDPAKTRLGDLRKMTEGQEMTVSEIQ